MNKKQAEHTGIYYSGAHGVHPLRTLGRYGRAAYRYLCSNRTELLCQWESAGYLEQYLLSLDARYEAYSHTAARDAEAALLRLDAGLLGIRREYAILSRAQEHTLSLLHRELAAL